MREMISSRQHLILSLRKLCLFCHVPAWYLECSTPAILRIFRNRRRKREALKTAVTSTLPSHAAAQRRVSARNLLPTLCVILPEPSRATDHSCPRDPPCS